MEDYSIWSRHRLPEVLDEIPHTCKEEHHLHGMQGSNLMVASRTALTVMEEGEGLDVPKWTPWQGGAQAEYPSWDKYKYPTS